MCFQSLIFGCLSCYQVTVSDMDDSTSSDMIGEFTCITAKLLEARDQVVSSILHNNALLAHCLLFLSFQVHCTDYDSDGSHDLIGSFETNLSQLQKAGDSSPVSPFFYLLLFIKGTDGSLQRRIRNNLKTFMLPH